jgi:Ca-activated chloride channel family protein
MLVTFAAFDEPNVAHCKRQVVVVRGDGPSNEGVAPENRHIAAWAMNVTMNALAIEESEVGLAAYYRDHVITDEGAFVVTAATLETYPARIRQKLLRELVVRLHFWNDRVTRAPCATPHPPSHL